MMYVYGIIESLYMTLVSTGIAYLIGIPLGILLIVLEKPERDTHHIRSRVMKAAHTSLGFVINVFRSIPFIILCIALTPLSRAIVGTSIGSTAFIVPLVIGSVPFIARMVESSIKEVDYGVVEAAKSMGASVFQIVWKVYLPEAKPSLLIGSAITVTTVFGFSAMAGFVGGGGLGAIGINWGLYRWRLDIVLVVVVLSVILVQILQEIGMRVAKKVDKRAR